MGEDTDIASLRVRISSLVDEEGALVAQAFQASRQGADRRGVDALFARVQALQAQRNRLQKQVGGLLGNERLHVAAEVWRPGWYEYRPPYGKELQVQVVQGPLGLQVLLPGSSASVRLETLGGSFKGPIALDAGAPQ